MVKSIAKAAEGVINLRNVTVLCVEPTNHGLDILSAMLRGFGVEHIVPVNTAAEAQIELGRTVFDLILADAQLEDGTGYELARWLRRTDLEPNRFAPFFVLAGHASTSVIESSRTCGASFVLAKPTSANVLMRRIIWVAAGGRHFVEAKGYVGPDRRWKYEGPPAGSTGRRTSDEVEVSNGVAEPNLSQDEINAVFKPQKVAL